MPIIKDLTTGKEVSCEAGELLLPVLQKRKIYVNNACNGKGTCGKCKVTIVSGAGSEMSEHEKSMLTAEEIAGGVRLACMTEVVEDITVRTQNDTTAMNVLSAGYVPDFEKDANLTGYGVAIDIGTTTVALSLVRLADGEIVEKAAGMNSQRTYGQDVLTRITYEMENGEAGIINLQKAVVDSTNQAVRTMCAKAGVKPAEIVSYSIAGNCTMTHMVLGVDARSIGVAPYKPAFLAAQTRTAAEVGLIGAPDAMVYCLAQVSGYIGGDILAGAYVCDLKHQEKNCLFLDIGTNGEMVLTGNGRLVSCSCAAGPALEGMNITSGMPALPGAIESVVIKDEQVSYGTIGDAPAEGICGSGILEVVSELLKAGFVKPTGAFVKKKKLAEDDWRQQYLIEDENGPAFRLADGVLVTQKDVRQVQLAKGAILSGFVSLLKQAGVSVAELDEVIIAGQFGSHLSAEALAGAGIIPKEAKDKVRYVGNTSKTGAYMALLSKNVREEMEQLAEDIYYFELAESEGYEQLFMECMRF
jgi:uncharacterized 2Fe-2S/4Fe-4S cluster protein (DUF4445 family)